MLVKLIADAYDLQYLREIWDEFTESTDPGKFVTAEEQNQREQALRAAVSAEMDHKFSRVEGSLSQRLTTLLDEQATANRVYTDESHQSLEHKMDTNFSKLTQDIQTLTNSVMNRTSAVDLRSAFAAVAPVPPHTPLRSTSPLSQTSTGSFRGRPVDLSPTAADAITLTPRISNSLQQGGDEVLPGATAGTTQSHDGDRHASRSTSPTPNYGWRGSLCNTGAYNPYASQGIMLGSSPLRGKRGPRNAKYLVGIMGIQAPEELSEQLLTELRFGIDIQQGVCMNTFDLLDRFMHPDINPKYVASFTKLEELTPELFIDWYTTLQFDLRRFNIGLMPFDWLVKEWAYLGLSYPGVGETRYLLMAQALFRLLDRLLLLNDTIVKECHTALVGMTQDGFQLLDSIMARSLPIFCASIPNHPPTWEQYTDVAQMAKM